MIDLYYWPTPNGHKITIMLEETGLPYKIHPIDISKGAQFAPDYLKISPNNKMPAIVDNEPMDGGAPLSIFESGAILVYLADKTKQFFPTDVRKRSSVRQWLFWQVGGLGPMAGQNHHFNKYAPEIIPYAQERYIKETHRLYSVLNKQLEKGPYVCGEYSIADMAIYPWTVHYEMQSMDLNEFPNIKTWFERMKSRPAVIRAFEKAAAVK